MTASKQPNYHSDRVGLLKYVISSGLWQSSITVPPSVINFDLHEHNGLAHSMLGQDPIKTSILWLDAQNTTISRNSTAHMTCGVLSQSRSGQASQFSRMVVTFVESGTGQDDTKTWTCNNRHQYTSGQQQWTMTTPSNRTVLEATITWRTWQTRFQMWHNE